MSGETTKATPPTPLVLQKQDYHPHPPLRLGNMGLGVSAHLEGAIKGLRLLYDPTPLPQKGKGDPPPLCGRPPTHRRPPLPPPNSTQFGKCPDVPKGRGRVQTEEGNQLAPANGLLGLAFERAWRPGAEKFPARPMGAREEPPSRALGVRKGRSGEGDIKKKKDRVRKRRHPKALPRVPIGGCQDGQRQAWPIGKAQCRKIKKKGLSAAMLSWVDRHVRKELGGRSKGAATKGCSMGGRMSQSPTLFHPHLLTSWSYGS